MNSSISLRLRCQSTIRVRIHLATVLFTATSFCLPISKSAFAAPIGQSATDAKSEETQEKPPTSWFELFVKDASGKAIPDASVEFRGSPKPTKQQFQIGEFDHDGRYGIFVKSDKFGRVIFAPRKETSRFSISIKHPGHGPFHAQYNTKSWQENTVVSLTAQLEPGWSIGGHVVDENGQPVAKAHVRPSIEYKKPDDQPYQLGIGTNIQTDENGNWSFHLVPNSYETLRVTISHADFRPETFPLSRTKYEIEKQETVFEPIELDRGIVVRGKVTDSDGQPIKGALIRTKFSNNEREARTNKDGLYELSGCQTGSCRIVVSATGKATDMQEIDLTVNPEPVNFQMQPGGHVRIVVKDHDGKPSPKARIFYQDWRGRTEYFEFDFKDQYADENGVWEWNEAPLDPFYVDVCPRNGMQLADEEIVARDEEYVFTPPPILQLSGTVVDAETKQPLRKFRVVPGIAWLNGGTHLNTRDVFTGTDGKFSFAENRNDRNYYVPCRGRGLSGRRVKSISFRCW